VVLIDYPGFNWWVARRAHFHGIPVFYFVPPSSGRGPAGASTRCGALVDHVLCNLPFEEGWYRERGVPAYYVGHPYFDELPRQRLDHDFMARRGDPARPVVALLPGSRTQEVQRNVPMILKAAAHIHAARPDARFLVACFRDAHRLAVEEMLRGQALPIEVCAGRTPEIISLAHACVAVQARSAWSCFITTSHRWWCTGSAAWICGCAVFSKRARTSVSSTCWRERSVSRVPDGPLRGGGDCGQGPGLAR